MHAVLALAFLHSSHLMQTFPTSSAYARYHWQQCLIQYNQKVAPRIAREDAEAMLLTSTLINGIAFALVNDSQVEQCWPFTNRTDDLLWLQVQSGISLIFAATFPLDDASKIKHIFEGLDDRELPVLSLHDLLAIAPEVCERCCIDEKTSSSENAYLEPFRLLVTLSQVPCNDDTIFYHLSFIASLSQAFRALLHGKDHNALLILSHWYANLCEYDCWWVSIRTRSECAAICKFLERYGKDVGLHLLEKPAKACGLELGQHRENTVASQQLEPQALIPCTPMWLMTRFAIATNELKQWRDQGDSTLSGRRVEMTHSFPLPETRATEIRIKLSIQGSR